MYYSVKYPLFFNPRILKSLSKCRNIVQKEGSSNKSEGRWESEGTHWNLPLFAVLLLDWGGSHFHLYGKWFEYQYHSQPTKELGGESKNDSARNFHGFRI